MKNVPKQMGEYLGEVLGPVWQTLTSSADTYVKTTVNACEEANDPTDSDGNFTLFTNFILADIYESVFQL